MIRDEARSNDKKTVQKIHGTRTAASNHTRGFGNHARIENAHRFETTEAADDHFPLIHFPVSFALI
jgi:hypothetical protein